MKLLIIIITRSLPFKRTGKIYNKIDSVTRDRPILTGKPLVDPLDRLIEFCDQLVTIREIRTPGQSNISVTSGDSVAYA
jgi:hypothetical protein